MLQKLCLSLILLFGISQCIPNPQKDLDDLINNVFNTSDYNPVITPYPTEPQKPTESPTITPNNGDSSGTCDVGFDCVSYYLCKDNKIITDGTGVIDIRIDDSEVSTGPKKCSYLDTCCPIGSKVTEPIIPKTKPSEQIGCGQRNVDGIGFKITGDKDNETEYGEFPWMVAILKEEQGLNEILNIYQCGGSLITSSVVLTAAHCVANKPVNSIKVRAGEWDTQTKKELFMDQDRDLRDIVVHENYYKGGLFNDIALLFVTTPFDLEENIQPVCLPPHNMNFDHIRCFATGWGKDTFGQAGQYQVILKKIDLPIVPNPQCQQALRSTRLGQRFQLHESFLCAGGEIGKDTCKGDGGSPLVCPIPNTINRYYQAGIVAWGIGCGDAIPGVYASISHLRPWIDQVLAKKNVPHTQFTYNN